MESTKKKEAQLSSGLFADPIRVEAFLEFMAQYKEPKTVHNKSKLVRRVIDYLLTQDKGDTKTADFQKARWVTKMYSRQMKAAGERQNGQRTSEVLIKEGKFIPLNKMQELSVKVFRKLTSIVEQPQPVSKKEFFEFQSKFISYSHCVLTQQGSDIRIFGRCL